MYVLVPAGEKVNSADPPYRPMRHHSYQTCIFCNFAIKSELSQNVFTTFSWYVNTFTHVDTRKL